MIRLNNHGQERPYTYINGREYKCLDIIKHKNFLGRGKKIHMKYHKDVCIFKTEADFKEYIDFLNHDSLRCFCTYVKEDEKDFHVTIDTTPYFEYMDKNRGKMALQLAHTSKKKYNSDLDGTSELSDYNVYNYIVFTFSLLRLITTAHWGYAAKIAIELSKHTRNHFTCVLIGNGFIVKKSSSDMNFIYPAPGYLTNFESSIDEFLFYAIPYRYFSAQVIQNQVQNKIEHVRSVLGNRYISKEVKASVEFHNKLNSNYEHAMGLITQEKYGEALELFCTNKKINI